MQNDPIIASTYTGVLGSAAGTIGDATGIEAVLPTIPGYIVDGVLGRGGMGVVYKARHLALKRTVALKTILSGGHANETERKRFRAEMEAVARLQHPNIVQVYEVGEHEGLPFAALEYVEGGTLAQKLQANPLPAQEAARLLGILAHGVQVAHSRNIIHRDLKPANVLLTPGGEPKITDFGLARQLDAEGNQTETGAMIGTPSYMAPEQARGDIKSIGPAADVYALGAILYECLTGRAPFKGASLLETLDMVRNQDPVAPRLLNPRVPRDLETICLKCLRKDPARRFASAAEFADDLQRLRDGIPIRSRPVGALERSAKWLRRRPVVATLIAAGLIVAAIVAGLLVQNARRVEATRADALVDALRTADLNDVPRIRADLTPYRDRVRGRLQALMSDTNLPPRQTLNIALVLSDEDPAARGVLLERLPGATPAEVKAIRDGLRPHRSEVVDSLWQQMANPQHTQDQRLRFAVLLAEFDAGNLTWDQESRSIARRLLNQNPLQIGAWAELFLPIKERLKQTLEAAFREDREAEPGVLAASVIAEMFVDDPIYLLRLLADASPRQASLLIPRIAVDRADVAQQLDSMLRTRDAWDSSLEVDHFNDPQKKLDRTAAIQTNAALALLRSGNAERIWPLLRTGLDDRVRTYLIHWMAVAGVDAGMLIQQIDRKPNADELQALLLALGHYRSDALSEAELTRFQSQVASLYREHPHPGVHAAAAWLSRTWKLALDLGAIDRQAVSKSAVADRNWYVAPHQQTFSVIRGPVEVLIGSPHTEHLRDWFPPTMSEDYRWRRIPRTYAVSSTELTVAHYTKMVRHLEQYQAGIGTVAGGYAASEVARTQLRLDTNYSLTRFPAPEFPVIGISIQDAMCYCRWLTEQEGIPESEQCYPPIPEIRQGKGPKPGFLQRTGYRLPTEVEWEYACRKDALTRYSFGADLRLLPAYARYQNNSGNSAHPVGQLLPNAWGLFDMHGNVHEWCHGSRDGWFPPYLPGNVEIDDFPNQSTPGVEAQALPGVMRGGSWSRPAGDLRAAYRYGHTTPGFQHDVFFHDYGFRIARTVRSAALETSLDGYESQTVFTLDIAGKGRYRIDDPRGDFRATRREGTAPDRIEIICPPWNGAFAVVNSDTDDGVQILCAPGAERPIIHPVRINSLGMKVSLIPAGSFRQGTDPKIIESIYPEKTNSDLHKSIRERETPPRRTTISKPFGLGVTEVTVEQFRAFVADSEYVTKQEKEPFLGGTFFADGKYQARTRNRSWKDPPHLISDRQPVGLIRYEDAIAFCDWLSKKEGIVYRLPTEAEWEYACRAGSDDPWFFGKDAARIGEYAWSKENSSNPQPVGGKKPNRHGLYDMLGNASEWCADAFHPDAYAAGDAIDPIGVEPAPQGYVIRGGALESVPRDLRPGIRFAALSEHASNLQGFRVAAAPWTTSLTATASPFQTRPIPNGILHIGGDPGPIRLENIRGNCSVTTFASSIPGIAYVKGPSELPSMLSVDVHSSDGRVSRVRHLYDPFNWQIRVFPLDVEDLYSVPAHEDWKAALKNPAVVNNTLPRAILNWGKGHQVSGLVGGRRLGGEMAVRMRLPAGRYELFTTAMNGHIVRVDGVKVMDSWAHPQPSRMRKELHLTQGEHDIRVELYLNADKGWLYMDVRPIDFDGP